MLRNLPWRRSCGQLFCETSAAPRGTATATTWQAAATGDTFRRRLLVGLDAVRQLHENGLALPSAPIPSLTLA